jgi:hypothetical protein
LISSVIPLATGFLLAIAVIGSLVNGDFASLKTRRPLLYL